jgi:FkbM family methyltransferase
MSVQGPYPLLIADLPDDLGLYVHDERDQHVSKRLREEGLWEPYETQLLLKILNPGNVLIDVGANLGYYTVIGSTQVGPSGKVFAFEPEPQNFELLQKNCHLNSLDNVQLHHAALSDTNGSGYIYLNESNLGDHQVYDAGEDRERRKIQMMVGSELLATQTDRADLIKIDTQGAEYHVLKGLEALILQSLPELHIIVEFWPAGLGRAGASGSDLLEVLVGYGLPMQIIDHIGHKLIPCTEQDLRLWIQDVDETPGNEGFINLLLGDLND